MQRCVLYSLLSCLLACGPEGAAPPEASATLSAERAGGTVLFLGTSLTAGYGLTPDQAYPARIQERIDAAGLGLRVINAGVSGDTSAGGLRRLDWLLRQPVRVLIIELGANDMLRGQSPEAMRENLQAIIDRTRAAHPNVEIVIAGMCAARNLGRSYAERFETVFDELAQQNRAVLIPFLLENVATVRKLNQSDGIHPTAAGHRIIAETVWRALEPVLRRVAGTS